MIGIDEVRGIYHFMTDRVPGALEVLPPKPRQANVFTQNGLSQVSKVIAASDLKGSIVKSIDLVGGLGKLALSGERVMVKPNFNSHDPYPASTDLQFLKVVIELLLDAGAKVVVGESSGGMWRPTRNTLAKLGVPNLLARMGIELIVFDDRPRDWVQVDIRGDYLSKVTVPRSVYEVERLVYLPCLKTHKSARFTAALKLAVGIMHPGERRILHRSGLEPKVAEINLVRQPDLIIIDGRKAFVTGGPDRGELVEPGIIMASGDMVAIDVEAMKVLLSYNARNKLSPNPWDSLQIATALRHRLGAGEGEYEVIT